MEEMDDGGGGIPALSNLLSSLSSSSSSSSGSVSAGVTPAAAVRE
jgi:hypothetical protein